MSDLDAACAEAMRLQLAGQVDQAERLYRTVLEAAPTHAAANYCIGMIKVQMREPAEALPHLLAALEAAPETPDYWLGYLEALLQAGRIEEARSTLALGVQHGLAGSGAEDFTRRLQERSKTPTRTERRAAALTLRKQEKSLLALVQRREFAQAKALALAMTERFPEHGLGWKVVGAFLSADGRFQEALAPLQNAVRLMPGDAEAHVNLGMNLFRLGRPDDAERHLKHAIALKPDLTSAHFRLAMLYGLGNRYADAEECLRRGFALDADYVPGDLEISFSNLLFLASHNPAVGAEELFAMHCRAGEHLEGKLRRSWPRHANDKSPDRPLRIGFVSADLQHHPVAYFVDPVLAHLRLRPDLELFAYHNSTVEDAVSDRLRAHFRQWRSIARLAPGALSRLIIEDRIDILIDLSGHSGENRLPVFARKPAPIQASWIGYPGTTGLRAMDYYLADRHFLPPGLFDRFFTEKIVYLPANVPFEPLGEAPPVNPLPALGSKSLCFASFNRMGKINPETIEMWCGLLAAVPDARLLIGAVDCPHEPLIERFAARGVDPGRLTLRPRCGMQDYLRLHQEVDICLDAYPYTGGTTTIHALWMGVPTLTVAGSTPASRQGAAILGQLGLEEFVAADGADLAAKGRYWAAHLDELAALRAGLRGRWQRSPARRPEIIAAALERGLRLMWRRWCDGLGPESFAIG